ncbi:MAG: 4Fe-4S binding protein [Actinobacteria bacterium]|nr:4Fe-4S binding protein [Actinomycetota bacterium]
MTVDGIPYPRVIIQGYLEFTRRQATAAGAARSFYEWGEILHLYDTATERILAARAAWNAGLRATPADLAAFSRATLESTPTYLDELYGGSLDLFTWDATLQILMKKWMALVVYGRRDVTWEQAGEIMRADEREFAAWDAWYRPARKAATVITYPERLQRRGEAPPRAGVLFLILGAAAVTGLWLRGAARGGRRNLLVRWPWIADLVHRRVYPEGVRALVLAVYFLMLGALAFGSALPHRNLGSIYLWIFWWPLVPFLLFFSARSWCAVCPVATLGDLVQRVPGLGRRRPPRALLAAGIWIIEGTFLAITWFDRSVGLVSSVRLTLIALLLLTGVALTVAALYQRRTFCRHLCFFGALAGNYSMASVVELRPDPATCQGCPREACRHEAAAAAPGGCPMLERPRALAGNRDCNLCLQCLRTCERGSLALRLRDPLRELPTVRRPRLAVAGLAAVLVGVVAVQNLGMLEVAGVMERRLGELTGLGRAGQSSLIYLTALLLPLLLLFVAAGGSRRAAAYFGYALIPLDLGAHAAHNLLHMLGEGRSVWWVTARLLGLSSPLDIPGGHPGGSMGAALLDAPTIKVLQLSLLLVAALGSFVVARRMQRRLGREFSFLPLYGLLLLLFGLNLWLFSVPMALRH